MAAAKEMEKEYGKERGKETRMVLQQQQVSKRRAGSRARNRLKMKWRGLRETDLSAGVSDVPCPVWSLGEGRVQSTGWRS